MSDEGRLEQLFRENRLLSTQLRRSEINRERLEAFKERNAKLYRGVIEDMHASQRLLEESERRAQQASRAKSAFLANMSHELRTPLNAVIGYTELVLEEGENLRTEQVADLGIILNAGRHLLRLIDSVLDLSKIEAERLELASEDVPLASIIREAADTARPMIEARGNTFTVRCGAGTTLIRTDRLRVVQVLLNLLANAGKFCEAGVVQLVVEVRAEGIRILVEDTGIGMTAEQLDRVFLPFVQADVSTTRKYGGTGLGLTVARGLAELLGGSITARSEPGRGATFEFWLPPSCIFPDPADSARDPQS